MNPWRYNRNGRPSDPIDLTALTDLLRTGALPPDTLVWREGMPDWAKANTLPEFSSPLPVPTPEAPLSSVETTPPSTPSTPPLPSGPALTSAPPALPFNSAAQTQAVGLAAEAADIAQNKVFAVLAYVGILFLVPLLAAPKSRFARFHTNQGVVLFLTSILSSVALTVLSFIPLIGCAISSVVFVGILVLLVMGIINAASGQFKPLPLIGHFELLKTDPSP